MSEHNPKDFDPNEPDTYMDEEARSLVAAIRRTQDEVRVPDCVNVREIVVRATEQFFDSIELKAEFDIFMSRAIELAHSHDDKKERRTLMKSLGRAVNRLIHVRQCQTCQMALDVVSQELLNYKKKET